MERFTTDRENEIIKEYYGKNKSMPEIAKEHGMSFENVRTIKEKGLCKLRKGKAKREILNKMEVVEASIYRTGTANYKRHSFTSQVEHIAICRAELEQKYHDLIKHIDDEFSERNSMSISVSK